MLVFKVTFEGVPLQITQDLLLELLDAGYTVGVISYDFMSSRMASRLVTASRQYLDNFYNEHFKDLPF